MYQVKISLPSHEDNISFNNFIPGKERAESQFNFHINTDIKKADFWFVFEDLKKDIEYCKVPKDNVIYLNNETSFKKDYFFQNYVQLFLNQFSDTYSCYPSNHILQNNTFPFLPWMIHANHGSSIYKKSDYDYDYFSNLEILKKTKGLSVICSNKINTENHSLRFEFLKIVKEYFGENIDWFGSGVNELTSKHKGIFQYKYHLVLENDSKNNLISEKLFDSYLGLSFPIYYGAPNISEYFNENSFKTIDINNVSESISTIESVLNGETYEKNINSLIESKSKVLNEFNFVNRIKQIINNKTTTNLNDVYIDSLRSTNFYWKNNTPLKQKIKREVKRKLRLH